MVDGRWSVVTTTYHLPPTIYYLPSTIHHIPAVPMSITFDSVQQALSLDPFDTYNTRLKLVPAKRALQPPPDDARIGATMALLYPFEEEAKVILGVRPDTMRNHAGQVAFPGGKVDPGETFEEAALRETEEEIGVAADQLRLIGRLDSIYIPPSNFYIHPFVAWADARPEMTPSEAEIAVLLEVPISHFGNPENLIYEERVIMGHTLNIPHFVVDGYKIFGGTCVILGELNARLAAVS